jgi:hypothetical protein
VNKYGYPLLQDQECGNCRYSRELDRTDGAMSCRRHAPVVTSDRLSADDPTTWGMWPAVFPKFWCGEWAPPEKVWK